MYEDLARIRQRELLRDAAEARLARLARPRQPTRATRAGRPVVRAAGLHEARPGSQ